MHSQVHIGNGIGPITTRAAMRARNFPTARAAAGSELKGRARDRRAVGKFRARIAARVVHIYMRIYMRPWRAPAQAAGSGANPGLRRWWLGAARGH